MYLAATEDGAWIRTPDVASAFGISLNHLQKAVQGLARAGYIEALQGRAGGVRLAKKPDANAARARSPANASSRLPSTAPSASSSTSSTASPWPTWSCAKPAWRYED
jgi:biotin operon repressor